MGSIGDWIFALFLIGLLLGCAFGVFGCIWPIFPFCSVVLLI